jgi:hypothetical protein
MSNTRSRSGRRVGLALVLILLVLAILAAPWLYLFYSALPYDDWERLAAENAEPFAFAAYTPQGELSLELDKADLYTLLLEYADPRQMLEEAARDLPRALDPKLERLGFTLSPEELRLAFRLKLFGFLPLPLQVRAEVSRAGDGLAVTPKSLYLGPWVHISAQRLAGWLREPLLAETQRISPAEYGAQGVTLRAGEDAVLLDLQTPLLLPELLDVNVTRISRLLAMLGAEELPPAASAALGPGFAAAFREAVETGGAWELLASYLARGEEAVDALLREFAADLPAGMLPDAEKVASLRREALSGAAEGQRRYLDLLEALRSLYREGELTLAPGGFLYAGRALELRDLGWTGPEPEFWRPVYLSSLTDDHPVAAEDMPRCDSLPCTDPAALPEGADRVDLGLLLAMADGAPGLLYRTAAGELVLRVLNRELAAPLLQAEQTPALLSDEVTLFCLWVPVSTAEDLPPVCLLY